MKFFSSFITFLSVFILNAENYSDKVKQLGQHGVPYFYNADLDANIRKWAENEGNATSLILGKSVLWTPELEFARKTNRLPWFIKYIPAANTGFDFNFMAADGSKGMWPLNYSIAKKYGLTMNSFLDERRNVEKSADAACRYLSDLQYIYKDWLKTITAFRIGAIRLNQVIRLANNSLDFNDIYEHLDASEKEVILQFYAAITVMYFRHDFGIEETEFERENTDTVSLPMAMKFSYIESFTGIKTSDIQRLNPQFISETIPWFGSNTVFKVPYALKHHFDELKDSMINGLKAPVEAEPITETDTVIEVRDSVIYISVVPAGSVERIDSTGFTVDTTSRVWVWYTVKTGDGFYTLSDVFDCSIEEMKTWNGIENNTLIANTLIKFYVSAKKEAYYKRINGLNHLQKREMALSD